MRKLRAAKEARAALIQTIADARAALADLEAQIGVATHGVMAVICAEVSEEYGIPVAKMRGKERTADVCCARAEAMRRIYDTGAKSLPQIGRFFGGRDHSTALLAIRKARAKMPNAPAN